MNIENKNKKYIGRKGFVLPLVIIVVVILSALAIGLMLASYLVRVQSVKAKCETKAMLAAEAGYEKAIYWMRQQSDILSSLQNGNNAGTIDFDGSSCSYEVNFDSYVGARPVFRIISTGTSGVTSRVVDVQVVQATTGWVMGKCRVPSGTDTTDPVYFAANEIIDIPIHINNLNDNPDNRDIYIQNSPQFKQKVEMGESRKTTSGSDKYSSVIGLFEQGISFDQPDVRITDEAAVKSKINRFRDSTAANYRFTPVGTAKLADAAKAHSAVQIEFFIENDTGMVQITNNCTVQTLTYGDRDYNTVPGTASKRFQHYNVYGYHFAPQNVASIKKPVTDTYVSQTFGGYESAPSGGQIYVDGDVIIGGDRTGTYIDQILRGKMTIVATGNIWIADSIKVDGERNPDTGMPKGDNPNVLGLISQRIVKIVDPGRSNASGNGWTSTVVDKVFQTDPAKKHSYRPIANGTVGSNNRALPHNMVVEAAVTVGGGGWGAEYVGSRKVTGPGVQDYLALHGSISECIRGVVGLVGTNGYLKVYTLDERLMMGILPGDIWFGGKYIPAPAGWHDYRPED